MAAICKDMAVKHVHKDLFELNSIPFHSLRWGNMSSPPMPSCGRRVGVDGTLEENALHGFNSPVFMAILQRMRYMGSTPQPRIHDLLPAPGYTTFFHEQTKGGYWNSTGSQNNQQCKEAMRPEWVYTDCVDVHLLLTAEA
jgi:hypothetical protein